MSFAEKIPTRLPSPISNEASFSAKHLLCVSNSKKVTDSPFSVSIAVFCGDNNACFDNQCGTISANSITYFHTSIKKKKLGHKGLILRFCPNLFLGKLHLREARKLIKVRLSFFLESISSFFRFICC